MAKSGLNSLDLSRVNIPRDYHRKAVIIVKELKKSGKGKDRYSDLEDFMERAYMEAVDSYEEANGEIKLATRTKKDAA